MNNEQMAWLIGLFLVGSVTGLIVAVLWEFKLSKVYDDYRYHDKKGN